MSGSHPSVRPHHPVAKVLRIALGSFVIVSMAIVYIALAVLLIPWRNLRIRLANVYGKIVGPSVVWISGARSQVIDRQRIQANVPAIYLFNHTSQLDLFLSIWLCPMGGCGTAKKQLLKLPFLGQAWWLSGHIVIDRTNRDKAIAAMDDVTRLIQENQLSVWMAPEGTASHDGRLLPFKKGFAHLAIATRLPVIPVVIENAHNCWPARTWNLSSGKLTVKVLEPIQTLDWNRESMDEHIQSVWQVVHDALGEGQRPLTAS